MKTKLKIFALIFAFVCLAILVMPNQVLAAGEVATVSTYEELCQELNKGNSVKLTKNIEINTNPNSVRGAIEITASGNIVIDGDNKYTISSDVYRALFEVYAETGKSLNLTFKDIKIVNNWNGDKAARGINTRTGNITLTLDNVDMQVDNTKANAGNPEAINIGKSYEGINTVNIKNGSKVVSSSGYGILVYNKIDLNIDKSTVQGYGALYMKGKVDINGSTDAAGSAGSTIDVTNNSTIIGLNDAALGETNSFGTIIFEDGRGGYVVNIKDSKITSTSTNGNEQAVILDNFSHAQVTALANENIVTMENSNIAINTKEKQIGFVDIEGVKGTTIILKNGVTSNVNIPTDLLAAGLMVKKVNDYYVVSEIEVDFAVSQDKEENNKDFVVGTVQTENTKETLNSSLKANEEVYKKTEEAIKKGENVAVEIKVEELEQDTIKEEEKQKIEEVVSNVGKVHQYFDISVLVKANEAEIGKLTELTDKVKLSMKLPKELIQEGRKFYILKLHDGKVEKIEAVVNGENLEFETKEFSLYALAYEDVSVAEEKDDTPKTGIINISTYVWLSLAVIALVGIATTKRPGKHVK